MANVADVIEKIFRIEEQVPALSSGASRCRQGLIVVVQPPSA